jgi:hypothetical protein
MNKLFALLIALTIISCSSPLNKEKVEEDEKKKVVTKQNKKKINKELPKKKFVHQVLDQDSVWFRDLIPYSTLQDSLISILGNPDSITILKNDCGGYVAGQEPWGDSVNIWYYGETEFVTFKDKAEIMSIKLKGWDDTLHHPKIILSENTKIEDLAKVFPQAVERSYKSKNVEDGKTYTFVNLEPKPDWDNKWKLKFFEGKLIEIIYYIPC